MAAMPGMVADMADKQATPDTHKLRCSEPGCTHEVPCLAVHAERGTLMHDDDGEHVVHMRD